MSDTVFQTAYQRLRSRYTDTEWYGLTPDQVSELIRNEIRAIDLERAQNAPEHSKRTGSFE